MPSSLLSVSRRDDHAQAGPVRAADGAHHAVGCDRRSRHQFVNSLLTFDALLNCAGETVTRKQDRFVWQTTCIRRLWQTTCIRRRGLTCAAGVTVAYSMNRLLIFDESLQSRRDGHAQPGSACAAD